MAVGPMNKLIKRTWVAALRSGEYQQGDKYLKNGCKYCVLGVLCDIVEPSFWCKYHRVHSGYQYITPAIRERCGLSLTQCIKIASLNDRDGLSFGELADWIEENL